MSASLLRVALRHIQRRRAQSLLVILGIALGVAVIIAIDVANASASRAFQLSTDAVAGRATHRIVGGPGGVPEEVYRTLRVELGARPVAPVVEGYVRLRSLEEQPVRLLGVDAFAEPPFRNYLGTPESGVPIEAVSALITEPNTALVSETFAQRHGLQSGAVVQVEVGAKVVELKIVGLLRPRDDLSRRALDGLLLADVATAQEVLDQTGSLSHIDLIVSPDGRVGRATLAEIETALPPGVRVERSSARGAAIEQMTRAFELNLTALSLLALIVGMFLIYNTMTFSVVQRRAVLGTLRTLGVTREEIFAVIVVEALALGLIGAGTGIVLGLFLSRSTVQLVTQTINDLYFVVSVRTVSVPPQVIAKGAGLGILAALLSSLLPALEATSIPPAGALIRSQIEDRARALLPWVTLAGVGLFVIGGVVLLLPTQRIDVAFFGLFCVVIGCAFLAPMATLLFMRLAQPVAELFGVPGRMAPRGVVRSLSRTSVAIAALTVAVSVIVGVGIMIDSFRQTVELWLGTTLQADIFVSPPSVTANRVDSTLDPRLVEQVVAFPGIDHIATARDVTITTDEGLPVALIVVSGDLSDGSRRFLWRRGDQAALWEAMAHGSIVVSEPFARRHGITPSENRVTFFTDRGLQEFRVDGVYYDYSSDQGTVLMRDLLYHRYWDDRAVSSLALWLAPERDVDATIEALRASLPGSENVLIQSNRGLRESVLEVFDRAFAITGALRLLATIVAFIGIISALMALQLERAREIGVLRAAGMTVEQFWGLTLLQTGLMGLTAGLLALPTGFVLALVLIYVINVRSFGWTLQLMVDPGVFLQAFVVALVAAFLGAIYPTFRMGRLAASEVLRGE